MTKQEAAKFVMCLKVNYKFAYRDVTQQELDIEMANWARNLRDYTYEQAIAGLDAYVMTDKKGFPPVAGQVIDMIHRLGKQESMSAPEAWARYRRAIRNGNYGAEEEYAKLPPEIQRITTPEDIRKAAQQDSDTLESVTRSLFEREYNGAVKREQEMAKIPERVRNLIQSATPRMLEGV